MAREQQIQRFKYEILHLSILLDRHDAELPVRLGRQPGLYASLVDPGSVAGWWLLGRRGDCLAYGSAGGLVHLLGDGLRRCCHSPRS